MIGIILISVMLLLLLMGFPIFLSLIIPSSIVLVFFSSSIDHNIIVQRMTSGVNSFTLLALPLFVFAAELIAKGKMGGRLIELSKVLVGQMLGGTAITVVVASLLFGSISGSGTASLLALGGILLLALQESKYKDEFSYGLISTSSSLSSLIPPGIGMILYATITSTSVKAVFLAGFSVGIIFALILIVYSLYYVIKNKIRSENSYGIKDVFVKLKAAFWALLAPIIILGGIYGGFVTPTESAALAVLYIIIIEVFVYRSFKLKSIFEIAFESARTSAMIMILVASGTILSYVMTTAQIPQTVARLLGDASATWILLLIIILFLAVGMFMDGFSAMVILVPILFPVVQSVGIDAAHFGLIILLNLAIGTITPPFGLHIFAGMRLFDVSYRKMVVSLGPFILVSIVALFIVAYFPSIALWLPNLLN